MDEGRVRELARGLLENVERPDVKVSSLARQASVLANLIDDLEHKTLFEMHLSGQQTGRRRLGMSLWSGERKARWDFREAFIDDRRLLGGDQVMVYPLEQIEEMLAKMKELLNAPEATAGRMQLPREQWQSAVNSETSLGAIVGNVRNRIASFAGTVEKRYGITEKEPSQRRLIFIGHGRSSLWLGLRSWLEERGLEWDEFNREPTAGVPTTTRLEEMLDEAVFALLVLTAEDEHSDGSRHARENVVHEVGLFQGRLGFRRAIVLLEETCQEFSNISGIGQVRFPEGKIQGAFTEVERVLLREGVLKRSER